MWHIEYINLHHVCIADEDKNTIKWFSNTDEYRSQVQSEFPDLWSEILKTWTETEQPENDGFNSL